MPEQFSRTTLRISDQADREALESALLRTLWSAVSGPAAVEGKLFDAADVAVGRGSNTNADLSAALDEFDDFTRFLLAVRSGLDQVAAAKVSDVIEISLDCSIVAQALEEVSVSIEEYDSACVGGGFWNESPEARARLAANRDAALHLSAEVAPAQNTLVVVA